MCLHDIAVLLVCLYILTKLKFAMSIEVEPLVENNFQWALGRRDAAFEGEHVSPEDRAVHHFDNEDGGTWVYGSMEYMHRMRFLIV